MNNTEKKSRGLVKTGISPSGGADGAPSPGKPAPAPPGGSKYRRVAKFLILIGSEEAAGILAHLDEDQVEAVSREIAAIGSVGPEEAEGILAEFKKLLSASWKYSSASRGGIDQARALLRAALGPEKGEEMLRRAVPPDADSLFGFLEEFSAQQIAVLLRDEAPQTVAMILSRLKPSLSARFLRDMEDGPKLDIVKRVARQGEVAPEVLERAAAALREKARNVARDNSTAIDGMGALAAILKSSDFSFGDKLLDELAGDDPELEKAMRERLYTLDDVCRMADRPLRQKLSSMSDREIALLLKGKKDNFIEKLLSNVSSQRRSLVGEEMDIMGAVKRRDVDAATGDFLAWFRTVAPSYLPDEDEVLVGGSSVTIQKA